ncbi:hypothetical protein SCP_0209040 [Sparassis crispa]|uniref:Uncharacterized protein n=1 Tax=Sparassis crispa TaxID=139825 RepID=A0A401GC50_9APHY|nr:hypothetical protein SCP_0209040 [Sparassis crispa]GBE79703.1 hypothetical protein SCP_0209040 [Sparassis crispa]
MDFLKEKVRVNPDILSYLKIPVVFYPESTNSGISGKNIEGDKYAATVWTVIERFGGVRVREGLDGVKVNVLYNIMTIGVDKHEMFVYLLLWFEKTETPNRYKTTATEDWLLRGIQKFVTFSTTDPVNLPVPSPALHAACARVVLLSIAGEYIDKIFSGYAVLANNGSSAEVQRYALASSLSSDVTVN